MGLSVAAFVGKSRVSVIGSSPAGGSTALDCRSPRRPSPPGIQPSPQSSASTGNTRTPGANRFYIYNKGTRCTVQQSTGTRCCTQQRKATNNRHHQKNNSHTTRTTAQFIVKSVSYKQRYERTTSAQNGIKTYTSVQQPLRRYLYFAMNAEWKSLSLATNCSILLSRGRIVVRRWYVPSSCPNPDPGTTVIPVSSSSCSA